MFVIRMPPRRVPPPPPPPPLEIGQALLNVTQILAQLAQNQAQNNEGNGRVTIREFLNLNPRTFDTPLKPLDADDWLREMNRTLNIARVAPADRVSFVTFLLRGESAAWRDSYLERRDPDVETGWDEFQALSGVITFVMVPWTRCVRSFVGSHRLIWMWKPTAEPSPTLLAMQVMRSPPMRGSKTSFAEASTLQSSSLST
jgi:hypothetical protein